MSKRFIFSITALFLLSLCFRVYLLRGNNIFFTVDQGRDAVYVREILTRGKIFLKGPETNIRGVFAGPLFYYFTAFGYFLTGGNPVGGVLILLALNLLVIIFLVLKLRTILGDTKSLLIGLGLSIFWPFFETSLWSFNPFPMVAISFLLVFLLIRFVEGKPKYYYYSLIPIALSFNAEIAGAMALFIFYLVIGLWGVKKRIIKLKLLLITAIILPLVSGLVLGKQFILGFVTTKILKQLPVDDLGKSGSQVFSGTNFIYILREFFNIIGSVTIPQNVYFGVAFFVLILLLFYRYSKSLKDKTKKFIFLSLALVVVSYIFFGSTQGWRSWQTVFLPPLLFVSVLMILLQIPKKFGIFLLALIVIFQFLNFKTKYDDYLKPNGNPSLMYNELSAIDWIYQNSHEQGFRVYNYTDTFYDYPYQYLFWWHGLKKYGYLPDEYSNFPLSQKPAYVPGSEYYLNPNRNGEGLKYLIIQATTNGEDNADWLTKFRRYHDLVDKTQIGMVTIEKYMRKNGAPNDFCIWWEKCTID